MRVPGWNLPTCLLPSTTGVHASIPPCRGLQEQQARGFHKGVCCPPQNNKPGFLQAPMNAGYCCILAVSCYSMRFSRLKDTYLFRF